MRDLATRSDIDEVLRAFYASALEDLLLRHVFVDVAQMDLEEHLPVIGAFWEKVLLGTGRYSRDAMGVHRRLHAREPLTAAHFERWLELWRSTVDARFDGSTADLAKMSAERIAGAMQRNLNRPIPGVGAQSVSDCPIVQRCSSVP